MYQSLVESEDKLRYFSARQIACRLLGGREHLCQKVYFSYIFFFTSHWFVNLFINRILPACSVGLLKKTACVQNQCIHLCGKVFDSGYICIPRFGFFIIFMYTLIITRLIFFSLPSIGFSPTKQYGEVTVASIWSRGCIFMHFWHS